ncbi:MAG TPA: ABC transporter permease [Puia sp.]|jgi:putative ABC transport system permease protein|nr:ABC transporter permease [Puia sp.]
MIMIKSYFRVAWRNLRKNKVYSSINIVGLAVGLSVFWMMALYISDELSYDHQSVNSSRIYRVVHSGDWTGGYFHLAQTPAFFGPTLKNEYPEIEASARIDAEGGGTLVYGDKKIKRDDILVVDNSLLSIFRFPFLYGDAANALESPNSIVLTRSLAEKFFDKAEDALNKTIVFQNGGPCLVTGVMEDQPANSHLVFSALLSMAPTTGHSLNSYLYTYVLLRKDANIKNLEARLPEFYDRHLKEAMGKGAQYHMDLQPLTSIHLHSNLDYEISRNSDIRYIYLFGAIAMLVLIIAVINYINLATARSSLRMREIGVRKVIGSGRKELAVLFLMESVVFTLLAALIAALLTTLLMPAFNTLSGKDLTLWQFGVLPTTLIGITFTLITGLLGGAYPAAFLSGFRTIPSLKGQQGDMSSTVLFRKSLVTFQFVVTIFLIAGSSILYLQLLYMQNRNLGFNKDQVLTFHVSNREVREHIEDLKMQLLQDPSIEAAAAAGNPIGNNDIGSIQANFSHNGAIDPKPTKVLSFYADPDYVPTLQIQLAAGRNFEAAQPTDRLGSVLVNETLVRELGWTNAIGKRVQLTTNDGTPKQVTIIGVVKDFNIYSLQHRIDPLLLQMPPVRKEEDNLYVRLNRNRIAQGLKYIEAVYRKWDPTSSFEYHFLDENFSAQYAAEKKQGRLLLTFTVLAIFIACMGLFGLVTFSVGQRTKEIGVRKVLGASVSSIVLLVSKELIKPVIIAVAISIPLAWYAMHRWLEGFAYRMQMNIWIFLSAGLAAAFIAMITVGWRAARAAKANPVKSLRTE